MYKKYWYSCGHKIIPKMRWHLVMLFTWSHILSGWPSPTDSDEKRKTSWWQVSFWNVLNPANDTVRWDVFWRIVLFMVPGFLLLELDIIEVSLLTLNCFNRYAASANIFNVLDLIILIELLKNHHWEQCDQMFEDKSSSNYLNVAQNIEHW